MLYSEKMLDAFSIATNHATRLLAMEGTIRSSKTATASSWAFYLAVCKNDEKYHLICGRSIRSIETNILEPTDVGLLSVHPNIVRKKNNLYFSFGGKDKVIILCNYSDSSTWKDVLGGTYGVIYIDEADIADKRFIDECKARQVSVNNPLMILTQNGNEPTHSIYQGTINYCKIIGKAPASIVSDMQIFQKKHGTKRGYYYMHFNMHDNPIMTEEKINDAMRLFPCGTHYYKIKILGERGSPGLLLFEEYMGEFLIVNSRKKNEDGRLIFDFKHFSFGIDVGATRAQNSICLVGFTKDYDTAVIIEHESFKQCGYVEKKNRFKNFISKCNTLWNIDRSSFDGILLDNAEQNFIEDMNAMTWSQFGYDTVGSYKATIKDRVDMMIVGFSSRRILFASNCRNVYEAYKKAVRSDKENEIREDKNEPINDIMDSVEYALTRHMKPLMRGGY